MAKFNYSQITKKSVDELIEAAFGGIKKARNSVQVAAVAVLMHAQKTGDYSKAQVLVDGVQSHGVYAQSLVAWFVEYGGLVVDEERGFVDWQKADYIKDKFQEAKKAEWWEMVKLPNAYKGMDFKAKLVKLLEQADKALQHAANKPEDAELVNIDEDMLNAVKALVA